jgi:uncharacterized protein YdeI (YjbR/CyaY-like superfamily)
VFYKDGTPSISYADAVEEARCWGWIDSLIKRVDDRIYLRKFSRRRAGSNWSASNRKRVRALLEAGRMQPPGLAMIEGVDLSAAPPNPATVASVEPPPVLAASLAESPAAQAGFDKLPPSHRRRFVAWISEAKRHETRERRAAEAVAMLERGERLGMK